MKAQDYKLASANNVGTRYRNLCEEIMHIVETFREQDRYRVPNFHADQHAAANYLFRIREAGRQAGSMLQDLREDLDA